MAETETPIQHYPFKRKFDFRPVKKPLFNDFHIKTLNPTSSKHQQQLVSGNGTSQSAFKKHDFSEFSEYGLDPEVRFRFTFHRIGAGLHNLGNTCFLNSVLQCLTYTEPLAAYLLSGKHKSSCHNAGFCALCAIQGHVRRALKSTGRILSPEILVRNMQRISDHFRNARQEDAHEYMVNLLESMHKCCLPSGVLSESPGAFDKSLVHKIFGGRLQNQVKCCQCSYSSSKFDPFLDLSLEIFKADSLQKALANFTAAELLDGGEKLFHCQCCNQKVHARKRLTIHKAPFVLAIHLKRFYAHDPEQKIEKKVQFGSALDLKPYVSGSHDKDVMYTLYGVLVHSGCSTRSGHYYCYVRISNNMWYILDDNRVSHVSEQEVLNQQAYMLFYVRDRKSFAPRNPVDITKEENVRNNVIGNRFSSTSNNALKDYPNGHVENKFSGEPSLTAKVQKKCLSSLDPFGKDNIPFTRDQMHNNVTRMLARGPEETVVACWDDMKLPSSQPVDSKNDRITRIGYVGDEWHRAPTLISTDAVQVRSFILNHEDEEEIEKELANDATFEELQKARSNGAHVHVFLKKCGEVKLKRDNKNRPMEASSKKPVPAFRDVIQAPKKVALDPRFESLCGEFDPNRFRKRYKFLYEDYLPAERQALKKELKKYKDPERIGEIEEHISWIDKQLKSDLTKNIETEILAKHKKKEREAGKLGKRPFYLKNSEIRKQRLVEKYKHLKLSGKLESYIEKRRKRNAAKDHRFMPYRRSGDIGGLMP